MSNKLHFKTYFRFAWIFLLAPVFSQAQCDIFKSEMEGVHIHLTKMNKLVDSLKANAETAAFTASLKEARADTRSVQMIMGDAVNASYESVSIASEAQYYSELCGIDDVKSYAIDAERFAIDARDFIDKAYENVKMANTSRNLGDIQYHMRIAQDAARAAQESAEAATNASSASYYSCHHNEDAVMESDK